MKKVRTAAFILTAVTAVVLGQESGKMVFLKLVQTGESVKVMEAEIVEGSPRERFANAATGSIWESVSADGMLVGSGTIPAPTPIHFDYADSTGKLTGGSFSSDTIEFFVRIPYDSSIDLLNFYRSGTGKTRSGENKIGSVRLREVLK